MLVLARKNGESIRIADDIVITIIELSRGRVRIGITAPADVPVYREELYRRIEAERRSARTLNEALRLVDLTSGRCACGLASGGSTSERLAAAGALA